MPKQQYAVFFAGGEEEKSPMQTWWNATTWFGREALAPVYFALFLYTFT